MIKSSFKNYKLKKLIEYAKLSSEASIAPDGVELAPAERKEFIATVHSNLELCLHQLKRNNVRLISEPGDSTPHILERTLLGLQDEKQALLKDVRISQAFKVLLGLYDPASSIQALIDLDKHIDDLYYYEIERDMCRAKNVETLELCMKNSRRLSKKSIERLAAFSEKRRQLLTFLAEYKREKGKYLTGEYVEYVTQPEAVVPSQAGVSAKGLKPDAPVEPLQVESKKDASSLPEMQTSSSLFSSLSSSLSYLSSFLSPVSSYFSAPDALRFSASGSASVSAAASSSSENVIPAHKISTPKL